MYTNLYSPRGGNIEDMAFSTYAYHTSECDTIINQILAGNTSFTIHEGLTPADCKYIESQLAKRGICAKISID